jgi:multicomponent Na+:H+ antiporter subunit A
VLGNPVQLINLGGAWPHGEELIIFVLAIIAAFATLIARSRLSAIISIGVVGVSVTLFFVIFSAPDLALTQ